MVCLVNALVAIDELLADFINCIDRLALADVIVPLEVLVVKLAESVRYRIQRLGRQTLAGSSIRST